jgi:hypothetical protein
VHQDLACSGDAARTSQARRASIRQIQNQQLHTQRDAFVLLDPTLERRHSLAVSERHNKFCIGAALQRGHAHEPYETLLLGNPHGFLQLIVDAQAHLLRLLQLPLQRQPVGAIALVQPPHVSLDGCKLLKEVHLFVPLFRSAGLRQQLRLRRQMRSLVRQRLCHGHRHRFRHLQLGLGEHMPIQMRLVSNPRCRLGQHRQVRRRRGAIQRRVLLITIMCPRRAPAHAVVLFQRLRGKSLRFVELDTWPWLLRLFLPLEKDLQHFLRECKFTQTKGRREGGG